jgi:site-specific DNA-methyltransferase (adenine-specific)
VPPSEPVYDDGQARIYTGDALAILAELPDGSVDVVMTDPPYSSGGLHRGDRIRAVDEKYPTATEGVFAGDNRDQRAWALWTAAWSWAARRVVRPGGHVFVFSDWRQLPTASDALQLGGWIWRGVVTWDKSPRGLPARGFFRNNVEFVLWGTSGPMRDREAVTAIPGGVVTAPTPGSAADATWHPTAKPTDLLRHLLAIVPPHPDGSPLTVLDPFMGAGSTLRAAKDLGLRSVGIEAEPDFCQLAARRLAQEVLFVPPTPPRGPDTQETLAL